MINFSIDIKPMGSVRMTQRGKYIKESAHKYLAYKNFIGMMAKRNCQRPITGPVGIKVTFYYPIPKKFNKKQRADALEGKLRPVVKPDLDNCIKGIYDSLNKIAWNDDNQVVEETSSKFYAEQPRIDIQIWEEDAA